MLLWLNECCVLCARGEDRGGSRSGVAKKTFVSKVRGPWGNLLVLAFETRRVPYAVLDIPKLIVLLQLCYV